MVLFDIGHIIRIGNVVYQFVRKKYYVTVDFFIYRIDFCWIFPFDICIPGG